MTVKEHALVVLPGREVVPLPCPELPELVSAIADAVIVSGAGAARVAIGDPPSAQPMHSTHM